jgi:uncharacterized membrane protein YdjX (TVP38/TMEM64 family)
MAKTETAARGGRVRASLAAAALVVLVGVVAASWLSPANSALHLDETVAGTVALIRSWGSWGVLGSIALMVVHSFVPFPAEIVACANGMVYGAWWGTLITWVGAMLGAVAAFGLARLLGWAFVHRLLPAKRRRHLAAWSSRRGAAALLISRLIPVIAFNLINYAAGLAGISWWTFVWTTGLGILPLTALFAVMGDRVLTLPSWTWLPLGAVVVIGWVVVERRLARAGGSADR